MRWRQAVGIFMSSPGFIRDRIHTGEQSLQMSMKPSCAEDAGYLHAVQ